MCDVVQELTRAPRAAGVVEQLFHYFLMFVYIRFGVFCNVIFERLIDRRVRAFFRQLFLAIIAI